MFVLAAGVPVLLLVVLGYATGYRLWGWLVGPDGAEPAGWATGALLLAVTTLVALRVWRVRRRR